jgi:hypothetical protein
MLQYYKGGALWNLFPLLLFWQHRKIPVKPREREREREKCFDRFK